jgi:hypothetical protein
LAKKREDIMGGIEGIRQKIEARKRQSGVTSAQGFADVTNPNGLPPAALPSNATQGLDQTIQEPFRDTRSAIQKLDDLAIDKNGKTKGENRGVDPRTGAPIKPTGIMDSFLLKLDLDQAIIQEGLLEPFRKKLEFARAKKFLKEVEGKELRRRGYTAEQFNNVAAIPNRKPIGMGSVRNTGPVAAKILPVGGVPAAMGNAKRTAGREGQGIRSEVPGMQLKALKSEVAAKLGEFNSKMSVNPGRVSPQSLQQMTMAKRIKGNPKLQLALMNKAISTMGV